MAKRPDLWTPERLDRIVDLRSRGLGWAAIERTLISEGVPVQFQAGNAVRSALAYHRPDTFAKKVPADVTAEPWGSLIASLIENPALSWTMICERLAAAGWPGRAYLESVRAAAWTVAPDAMKARLAADEERRALRARKRAGEQETGIAACAAEDREERRWASECCAAHGADLAGLRYPDVPLTAMPRGQIRILMQTASPRLGAALVWEWRDRKPLPLHYYPQPHAVAHAGVNAGRP